jgi:uncharacterized protein (DUF4415 family)
MKKKAKATGRKASGKARGKKIRSIKAMADEARGLSEAVGTMYKPIKKPVTLRLDADVVAWFKVQGKGYQTRINSTLRRVMKEEKKG